MEQVREVANWLADRFLKDGFSIQCDKDTVWKGQTYDDVYWVGRCRLTLSNLR